MNRLCNPFDGSKMPLSCSATYVLIKLWPQMERYSEIEPAPSASKDSEYCTNLAIKQRLYYIINHIINC
jgi:hypothetical protein